MSPIRPSSRLHQSLSTGIHHHNQHHGGGGVVSRVSMKAASVKSAGGRHSAHSTASAHHGAAAAAAALALMGVSGGQFRGRTRLNLPLASKFKTEMCHYLGEQGFCPFGVQCTYAHAPHELRHIDKHPKHKTTPCRDFSTVGFCPFGERCSFIHNKTKPEDILKRINFKPSPSVAEQIRSFQPSASSVSVKISSVDEMFENRNDWNSTTDFGSGDAHCNDWNNVRQLTSYTTTLHDDGTSVFYGANISQQHLGVPCGSSSSSLSPTASNSSLVSGYSSVGVGAGGCGGGGGGGSGSSLFSRSPSSLSMRSSLSRSSSHSDLSDFDDRTAAGTSTSAAPGAAGAGGNMEQLGNYSRSCNWGLGGQEGFDQRPQGQHHPQTISDADPTTRRRLPVFKKLSAKQLVFHDNHRNHQQQEHGDNYNQEDPRATTRATRAAFPDPIINQAVLLDGADEELPAWY